MKRKSTLVIIFSTVCALLLTSCYMPNNALSRESTDCTLGGEKTEVSGSALKDGNIELEISESIEIIQTTQDAMITNTKQIVVTTQDISNEAEINLYLFTGEDLEDPIGYATLSIHEKKATFSNLTSAVSYRIGAILSNLVSPVTITISD